MGFFFFLALVIGLFTVIKSVVQQRERIDGIRRSSLDSDFGKGPRDLNGLSPDEAKRVRAAMARQIVKDLQKPEGLAPKGSVSVLLDPKVQQLQVLADATRAARAGTERSQVRSQPPNHKPPVKPQTSSIPSQPVAPAPQPKEESGSSYFAWKYEPETVPAAEYNVLSSAEGHSDGQPDPVDQQDDTKKSSKRQE